MEDTIKEKISKIDLLIEYTEKILEHQASVTLSMMPEKEHELETIAGLFDNIRYIQRFMKGNVKGSKSVPKDMRKALSLRQTIKELVKNGNDNALIKNEMKLKERFEENMMEMAKNMLAEEENKRESEPEAIRILYCKLLGYLRKENTEIGFENGNIIKSMIFLPAKALEAIDSEKSHKAAAISATISELKETEGNKPILTDWLTG